MANEEIDTLLNEIGNILATDMEYPLDGTFLYAEAEDATAAPSVFKDLGDRLLYRWAPRGLGLAILDLWDAAPSDRKWAAMEYRIEGGQFKVSFIYADEIDPNDTESERRERVLENRFGNKKVDYPTMEDHAVRKRANGYD